MSKNLLQPQGMGSLGGKPKDAMVYGLELLANLLYHAKAHHRGAGVNA